MNSKSFTLIELFIIMAVISTLAVIAIPNLLRVKIDANEAAALKALRTLNTAFESFYTINGRYPHNFGELKNAFPPYIDYEVTESSEGLQDWIVRQGYRVDMCVHCSSNYSYIIEAKPLQPGRTGNKWYRITESGMLEFKDSQDGEYQPLQ